MMVCDWVRDRIQARLRDYDSLESLAVVLLYIQIGTGLIGCLGASYNGVLVVNVCVALFALVAIQSSSQSLGRTYAVLLLCLILIDVFWFILFSNQIWMFHSLLKSCPDARSGNSLHACILKLGHLSCLCVSKSLLNMYAKCGSRDCYNLFSQIGNRDHVVWNILISAPRKHNEAIRLFRAMLSCGHPKPNPITIATLCARLRDFKLGRSLHSYALKAGFEPNNLVGNALVSMYAKCGLVCYDAYTAFTSIHPKDVVSWNALIAGFSDNGLLHEAFRLFTRMMEGPTTLNHVTVTTILPVCASLDRKVAYYFGKQIHGYVIQRPELVEDVFVSNSLLSFYLRLGKMEAAEYLFERMKFRDLVSWNAIISGYTSNGEWLKAMGVFHRLVTAGTAGPDSVTIVSTLPACAHLGYVQVGKMIHGYVLRHSVLREDTTVGNSMITFYANCNNIFAAYQTFSMMPEKDLISWNSMLDCFAQGRSNAKFMNLLANIFTHGVRPDSITLLIIVRFCISVSKIEKVKEAHSYSIRAGFLPGNAEPTIGNAILDAYAKCGDMKFARNTFRSLSDKTNLVTFNSMISGYVNCGSHDDARMLFNKMSETDLTSWNLMIRVYAENGVIGEAIHLLHELQAQGMRPDGVTIMSLIPVCAQTASVHLLRQCHGYVIRARFDDVRLMGALLDAYAKCGGLDSAYMIYQSNPHKDLVMFTAMIGGFAMHGRGEEALGIFSHLLEMGLKPDHVIMTAVLSACSHAGLVSEGLKIFHSIEGVHGITPNMEQYSCVVDLLARSGRVEDAFSFVHNMPVDANANIWGTLLGACKTHHKVELGRIAADKLFEMESDNVGNYVVMANLYASDARWDRVADVRRLMRARDLKKPAGCSWIEIETTRNVFIAGDSSHPQRIAIYKTLRTLDKQVKSQFSY